MKKYKVYRITNILNNKTYIGYTSLDLSERFKCHKNSKDHSMLIVRSMKKYGPQNFMIEELNSFDTKDEATSYEIKMISEHSPEYNIHPGGIGGSMYGAMNGMYGKKHTDEWKKMKSVSMIGDKNPMYGKTHSQEVKALLSEMKSGNIPWNKDRKGVYSEETLQKFSRTKTESHRQKLSKTYTFLSPENEVVSFTGLLSFCKDRGLSAAAMSDVYNGKRTTTKTGKNMSDMTEEIEVKDPDLERQWKEWLSVNDVSSFEDIDEGLLRETVISDLTNVSNMTVEEYTLFQKWCEIHDRYPTREVSTLFGVNTQMVDLEEERFIKNIKNNIWIPEKPDDYLNLKPELIYTKDAELSETWNCIRTFTSTMKNNSNIGRNLNYIVVDRTSGKYLGVMCISSDFLDLTPRDKFIGWEREKKTQGHMINYTAIGSTIVPLQPLGYNYVGGKLLALLCLSDEVQHQWKKQYGDVLAGVTTTSLYGKNKMGGLSQYDNLKHWKKMGFSSGSVSYETTKKTVDMIRAWLKKNHTRKYFEWYYAKKPSGQPYKRDHKNRSYNFTYSKIDIPKDLIRSEHQRGIYFSPLYNNTNEFLRGEIKEDQLVKSFDTSYDALVGLWKEKYASKRIRSLEQQNRVSTESLFYDDLIFLDWEQTKEKYLPQVGR